MQLQSPIGASIPMDEEAYVQEAFRVAIGVSKDAAGLLPAVPSSIQQLFTCTEEYVSQQRDQWDNWEHAYSDSYRRGRLWLPDCDLWMQQQRTLLRQKGVQPASLWPKGHQFAVCLTHDVDYIGEHMTFAQRGREIARHAKAVDLGAQQKLSGCVKGLAKLLLRRTSLLPATTNTLEISYLIEQECGVSASYFFTIPPLSQVSKYDCVYGVNDKCRFLGKSRRVKEVMSFLLQAGCDVGLHGSYFSAVTEGLLAEQKAELEKAIQGSVYTTRQHWLHMHLPRTWQLQAQAGFQADTTLGFNRNIGYRAGSGLPFFVYDRNSKRQLNLIETPLVIQDGALVGANALEYSVSKALEVVKDFVAQAKATEGCLTFLFHPDIFLKPGLAPLYRAIIQHCLQENAWVTDLNSLQQWWRERAEKLS